MNRILWIPYLAAAAALSLACSAASPSEAASHEDVATNEAPLLAHGGPGPHLLWRDETTGEMSAWLLDGTQVTGTQTLSARCDAGCAHDWKVVDTRWGALLWHDPYTGVLADWRLDADGVVTAPPALSWSCDAASGCSDAWRPIGEMVLQKCATGLCREPPGGGVLWHDASSGELSIWTLDLDGHSVTGTLPLSWRCGGDCARQWTAKATVDLNGDGSTDVLWHNEATGEVAGWLVDGTGAVTGTQSLSRRCGTSTGCAQAWRLVDAYARENTVYVLWFNPETGELSLWASQGGDVFRASSLSWRCDAASGCSQRWKPVGFIELPDAVDPCTTAAPDGPVAPFTMQTRAYAFRACGALVAEQQLPYLGAPSGLMASGGRDYANDPAADATSCGATQTVARAWFHSPATPLAPEHWQVVLEDLRQDDGWGSVNGAPAACHTGGPWSLPRVYGPSTADRLRYTVETYEVTPWGGHRARVASFLTRY